MLDDHIRNLVEKKVSFDHLMAMGMIGPGGKRATSEASRRNSEIRRIQKSLGVESKTLENLAKMAVDEGWFK